MFTLVHFCPLPSHCELETLFSRVGVERRVGTFLSSSSSLLLCMCSWIQRHSERTSSQKRDSEIIVNSSWLLVASHSWFFAPYPEGLTKFQNSSFCLQLKISILPCTDRKKKSQLWREEEREKKKKLTWAKKQDVSIILTTACSSFLASMGIKFFPPLYRCISQPRKEKEFHD